MEQAADLQKEIIERLKHITDVALLQKLLQTVEDHLQGGDTFFNRYHLLEEHLASEQQEKKRLLNVVALWLKSPLSSLQTLASMLHAETKKEEHAAIEPFAEHLLNQVNTLQNTSKNLLEWACLAVENYSYAPEPVSVLDIAQAIVVQYAPYAEKKGIDLRFENNLRQDAAFQVQADRRMLRIILENLVENAIKFSTKEGEVVLQLTNNTPGKITFTVKDSGIGMGNAKQRNAFNIARKSEQRGTANEQGFGLGLAVTKALLSLHQAAIQLESERGKGTTISFQLPTA